MPTKTQVTLTVSFLLVFLTSSISIALASPTISFDQPYYPSGGNYPITITIDDSLNPLFTDPESGIQKINAIISSNVEEKQITLTETTASSGIFTTTVGTSEIPYEFHVNDKITIIQPHAVANQNNSEIESINAIFATIDPLFNIKEIIDPFILTETGQDTGIFTGDISLVNESTTSTQIKTEPGDLIIYQYDVLPTYGIILPNSNDGVNMIQINVDNCDNELVDILKVSYLDISSTIDIKKSQDLCGGGGGGGGGGALRPGFVLNFIGSLFGGSVSEPPTLGLDQNQKRIVDGGFSFNDNPVDVEQFYTPYPLITTEVGKLNTIKLKIYDNNGLDDITHVGLTYGLGKGEIFNEGRATIEYDKTFDRKESVSLFDPKHVLGSVNVTSTTIPCSINNNAQCLEVTFDHIFRESLEYNMVATNIWDFERNGWQNYFNHGIQIVGESMNPAEEYSGIFQGHIFHLTETGKNTAIDDEGNSWAFDKTWIRDYIKPVNVDSDILNQKKVDAIEQLGFKYSDGKQIFGFKRIDHRFADIKNQQQMQAQSIMNELCSKCQQESFKKIKNIFSYEMPTHHSKINNPETINQMQLEDQKARQFLQEFFEQIYPDKVND